MAQRASWAEGLRGQEVCVGRRALRAGGLHKQEVFMGQEGWRLSACLYNMEGGFYSWGSVNVCENRRQPQLQDREYDNIRECIMVKHQDGGFKAGMNMVVSEAGKTDGLLLDFGILNLSEGDVWTDSADKERALLLIEGNVRFEWKGRQQDSSRAFCFDENPEVLQVPAGMEIQLTAGEGGAQLCYEACVNSRSFEPVFYSKADIRSDVFGAGTMAEASTRTVRTVFDGEIAEFSNMVMGEVINHPGKWSSYPPHDHPHPEIYHYRMFPRQGFGVSLLENDAHIVRDGSTSLIYPNLTHSQVAGAGYAMYYIWMIPHLPNERWLPSTRYFRKEHEWLMDTSTKIWPERKPEK